MSKAETKIRGYRVEFERWEEDGKPRTSCIVSIHAADADTTYSASLGVLEDFGTLESDDMYLTRVSDSDIRAIRAWADSQGY